MRAQDGQSTLEYVALVLLVLAVLAAGLLVVPGSGIAQAVVAQVQRAICLVGGGECGERARAPCVTRSSAKVTDVGGRVAIVRLSAGSTALREHRSDGSVVVKLVSRGGLGLEADVGAELGIGGWRIGGSLGGLVEGRLGRGRVWRLRSDAEADELMRSLSAQAARSSPRAGGAVLARLRGVGPPAEPDETFGEQGLGSELRARLGRVGLQLEASDLMGSRTDRASDELTFTIRRNNALSASVAVLAGVRAAGAGAHEELYGLTVDGSGRPVALTVVETLRIDGGARLPGPLHAALGGDSGERLRAGRVAVLERHLDLADSANLAAAGAFVRALRQRRLRMGDAVAVSSALRERLDGSGSARALLYDVDADRTELHGKVSAGVGMGGRFKRSTETIRLLAAGARPPGGQWSERSDCMRAV